MVDFYSDKNGIFLKDFLRANQEEITKLEKTASINEDWPPFDSLTKEAFADTNTLTFPIFSKTAALTSALYIKAQNEDVPYEVKKRAQEACDLFGINEDIIGYEKVASVSAELTDDDFIFPEQQKLPVVDKNTLDFSTDIFLKVANELPALDVVVGARRLIKKAYELDANIDPEVEKLSLLDSHISNSEIAKLAEERYNQTLDSAYLELSKIASVSNKSDNFEYLSKLIDEDRNHNVDKTKVTILKVASIPENDIIHLDGKEIPLQKIASIPEDEWSEIMPFDELSFISNEDGSFNKEAFEQLYHSFSSTEKDMINGFIQNKL